MKISDISGDKAQKAVRGEFWHRLAFNKWTMTFAVILVVLSACMGLEQSDDFGGDEVLYVSDELPYDIRKVSGEGTVEVLPEDDGVADDAAGDKEIAVAVDRIFTVVIIEHTPVQCILDAAFNDTTASTVIITGRIISHTVILRQHLPRTFTAYLADVIR